MAEWTEEITHVAGTDLAIVKGGQGKPLLDSTRGIGPSGMADLACRRWRRNARSMIPIQPGFGKSPASSRFATSTSSACSVQLGSARDEPRAVSM